MVILFNESDLVSFGNFLLASVRNTESEKMENRLDGVTHADLENWAYLMNQEKQNEGSNS